MVCVLACSKTLYYIQQKKIVVKTFTNYDTPTVNPWGINCIMCFQINTGHRYANMSSFQTEIGIYN